MSKPPSNDRPKSPDAASPIGRRGPRPKSMRETWWPPISDAASARQVARYGFWASVVHAAIPAAALIILLATGGKTGAVDAWALIEIGLFAVIAVGLYHYSPAAAVAAPVVYVAARIVDWLVLDRPPGTARVVIAILFMLFFIHGVRGTFALRRFTSRS